MDLLLSLVDPRLMGPIGMVSIVGRMGQRAKNERDDLLYLCSILSTCSFVLGERGEGKGEENKNVPSRSL